MVDNIVNLCISLAVYCTKGQIIESIWSNFRYLQFLNMYCLARSVPLSINFNEYYFRNSICKSSCEIQGLR